MNFRKKRSIVKLFVMLMLVFYVIVEQEFDLKTIDSLFFNDISNNQDSENEFREVVLNPKFNSDSILNVTFCPSIDCYNIYKYYFDNAKRSIYCAVYEFDDYNLSKILKSKSKIVNVSLIVDDKYLDEVPLQNLVNSNVNIFSDKNRNTRYNNYMHNKFCVIDENIVITGSANPTRNGFYFNNNNILVFNSNYLAQNYLEEFIQLKKGIFGYNKDDVLKYNEIEVKFENETVVVSSYFCPQNQCSEKIVEVLNRSKKEILFANFVLTNDDIENILVEKASKEIMIKGVVEKRMFNSKGSILKNLSQMFEVYPDKNPKTMHNKYFIVDERYVITGSMNPSKAGDKYNDENILVIEGKSIAKLFKGDLYNILNLSLESWN